MARQGRNLSIMLFECVIYSALLCTLFTRCSEATSRNLPDTRRVLAASAALDPRLCTGAACHLIPNPDMTGSRIRDPEIDVQNQGMISSDESDSRFREFEKDSSERGEREMERMRGSEMWIPRETESGGVQFNSETNPTTTSSSSDSMSGMREADERMGGVSDNERLESMRDVGRMDIGEDDRMSLSDSDRMSFNSDRMGESGTDLSIPRQRDIETMRSSGRRTWESETWKQMRDVDSDQMSRIRGLDGPKMSNSDLWNGNFGTESLRDSETMGDSSRIPDLDRLDGMRVPQSGEKIESAWPRENTQDEIAASTMQPTSCNAAHCQTVRLDAQRMSLDSRRKDSEVRNLNWRQTATEISSSSNSEKIIHPDTLISCNDEGCRESAHREGSTSMDSKMPASTENSERCNGDACDESGNGVFQRSMNSEGIGSCNDDLCKKIGNKENGGDEQSMNWKGMSSCSNGHCQSMNSDGTSSCSNGHCIPMNSEGTSSCSNGHCTSMNSEGTSSCSNGHCTPMNSEGMSSCSNGHCTPMKSEGTSSCSNGHCTSMNSDGTSSCSNGHCTSMNSEGMSSCSNGHCLDNSGNWQNGDFQQTGWSEGSKPSGRDSETEMISCSHGDCRKSSLHERSSHQMESEALPSTELNGARSCSGSHCQTSGDLEGDMNSERVSSERMTITCNDGDCRTRATSIGGSTSTPEETMTIQGGGMSAQRSFKTDAVEGRRRANAENERQEITRGATDAEMVNSGGRSSAIGDARRMNIEMDGATTGSTDSDSTDSEMTHIGERPSTAATMRDSGMWEAQSFSESMSCITQDCADDRTQLKRQEEMESERRGLSDAETNFEKEMMNGSAIGADTMGPQDYQPGLCVYTVTTETGKKWGSGTDSTISLRLINREGKEVYFPTLDNGKNNFERGQTDQFQVLGDCVSKVCKMVLYTDDSGVLADWYVNSVGFSVSTPAGKDEKKWVLNQWLPKSDASAALFVLRDDCH